MNPIINSDELADIYLNPDVVIVDVSNGKEARNNFDKKHIFDALFVDLNQELSAVPENPKNGGRHPLSSITDFVSVLESKGIDNASHVICYDNHFGANAAARFWWMLRAIGHEKVQVLNGGFQIPDKYDFLLSDEITEAKTKSKYSISPNIKWKLPTVSIDEVLENTKQNSFTVIDVRESERYAGISEPIDLAAGHIPGAVNVPFKSNLTSDGFFRSKEEIRKNYKAIQSDIAIHCGSGVTACHSILAMDYAGVSIPSLYVGSWSEWSRSGNSIAKGLI
jgi:thiosulfate/3-mercaptopyruvate sulfurtransferase